ncbi:unnamed protein product [Aphanomyces euteiches]|uniref:Uncharacterized protein n=1 Tax=Aphanomyces euteiches TaxID=100861 RepID=A0A6G0XI52_9STRA|nr:hypothetical protein Ae201684_004457 [Aphanomyces euteiches]KAH9093919.1 hypothetical protein Ae201684P_016539 [Aphanomyces euteiches]KAH9109314.1 hypothetical protein AeMF1_015622 [Aphanomyces euteiches]KAH9135122.1 hypothetical protein LEN26_006561 [Aphanomyces euteiches]KAH9135890.1 hypothetical protein AeRB84_018787 [Aphanomyces euteiches]
MLRVAALRTLAAARPAAVARPVARAFSSQAPTSHDADVVIPELSETLEWTLSSPPPLHQFEESPIIVETWGPTDPHHH